MIPEKIIKNIDWLQLVLQELVKLQQTTDNGEPFSILDLYYLIENRGKELQELSNTFKVLYNQKQDLGEDAAINLLTQVSQTSSMEEWVDWVNRVGGEWGTKEDLENI